ncbi:DNA topoisomerase IV subunit A [Terrihabitans rhizophilus]|uniref:DNA topoisomerase 4 subunit A n=1 Tax=Terrihabitans rhizophilus TaxID=3092662 RepID=A0ABU4RP84_9HYPH|nr:DNA topoisomerase IV subunit A [Terrihabitans sp. PJ23]MDX6806659.1 DNA topoisomerase IV subunit A [Terrihabitans sp. PJ23]
MGEKVTPPSGGDGIEAIDLRSALEERYLAYALSTITQRALPDARDGLKPVHRRLLYAMRLLRLDPGQAFKKSARVVGDVIGKYHPHGDQSVYDALVRLAQDFSQRWPLVEGQGNFGNVDGDNAAAMRYTEARLTEVARLLLDGLDEDAVDFRETYDGSEEEPLVLPGAFPNLLANGSQGIAVGMATSIPPHNASELLDAAILLIDNPAAGTNEILHLVPGPDFPTGGVIVEQASSIADAYRTGRGGFRVRARWHKEDTGRGTWVIIVTEIPYLVPKSRLIEQLASMVIDRKVPILADIRDESADDIRIVLEPRARTVDPEILMESLFKLTDLEFRISLNMNVLVQGRVPQVLGLAPVLREWLAHRRDVVVRRARFRLAAIDRRLEVLGGLLIAFLNLDEVIRIVREEDDPKAELIRRFELTEVQAEAILNIRLRALAKLEEIAIRKEHDGLSAEKASVEALLASDVRQWNKVKKEIAEVRKSFGPETALGKRRSSFAEAPDKPMAAITEAFIEREPVTVIVSRMGWVRTLKGHVADFSTLSFKADDSLLVALPTETTAKILVLATNGKVFTLDASRLPGGRGQGDPIRHHVDLEESADIALAWAHVPGARRLLVADDGRGFSVREDDLIASTRKGRNVLNLDAAVKVRLAPVVDGDMVAIVGENRKLLVFPLVQVPELSRGRGVRMQKYKDGGVADVRTFDNAKGLTWLDTSGRTWTLAGEELRDWIGNRADAGRLAPKGFPRTNRFKPS